MKSKTMNKDHTPRIKFYIEIVLIKNISESMNKKLYLSFEHLFSFLN